MIFRLFVFLFFLLTDGVVESQDPPPRPTDGLSSFLSTGKKNNCAVIVQSVFRCSTLLRF